MFKNKVSAYFNQVYINSYTNTHLVKNKYTRTLMCIYICAVCGEFVKLKKKTKKNEKSFGAYNKNDAQKGDKVSAVRTDLSPHDFMHNIVRDS